MNKISKYFRGVAEEARRVRWPDQKTLWKSVAIVLTITIVAALTISLSDWLTVQIMRAFNIAFHTSSSSDSSSVVAEIRLILGGGKF